MFRYTAEKDHCYIYKQPETADQMQRVIQAMEAAEALCVRCRSRDKELLQVPSCFVFQTPGSGPLRSKYGWLFQRHRTVRCRRTFNIIAEAPRAKTASAEG